MIEQLSQQESNYADATRRTGWALDMDFSNIPTWMHDKKFCVWTAEPRENGKVNKAPRHPNGGWRLSVKEPDQWAIRNNIPDRELRQILAESLITGLAACNPNFSASRFLEVAVGE